MGLFKRTIPRVRRYKIETDEDWEVEIKIGDQVMDMFGDWRIFHVEVIRESDGCVWRNDNRLPYYHGHKNKFHHYHMAWGV